MNETTEKKKGKFNFFDALLILLVLALLAAHICFCAKKQQRAQANKKGSPFAILCAII